MRNLGIKIGNDAVFFPPEWRKRYTELLSADITHGDTMMAGLLAVAIRGVGPVPETAEA